MRPPKRWHVYAAEVERELADLQDATLVGLGIFHATVGPVRRPPMPKDRVQDLPPELGGERVALELLASFDHDPSEEEIAEHEARKYAIARDPGGSVRVPFLSVSWDQGATEEEQEASR